MIHFGVEADQIIDLFKFDEGRDVALELLGEGRFDCVDERDLFVANQIGVVGRAESRVVAVEVADVVIDVADLVDSGTEFVRQFHTVMFFLMKDSPRKRRRRSAKNAAHNRAGNSTRFLRITRF